MRNGMPASIYMGYPREAVADLLLPVFLPFNLLKGGLNAALTFLLYKPVVTVLRRTGYAAASAMETPYRKRTGLILPAVFIVLTCILILLSVNGLI